MICTTQFSMSAYKDKPRPIGVSGGGPALFPCVDIKVIFMTLKNGHPISYSYLSLLVALAQHLVCGIYHIKH